MQFERASMAQFEEIRRLIEIGQSDRQIARSLGCRRLLVRGIRAGGIDQNLIRRAKEPSEKLPPGWALHVDWEVVEKDIREGYQIKRIWEEMAQERTSHPNFFKYIKKKFELLLNKTVTLREFKPGAHCEVDYAGDKIDWIDPRTGDIHQAHVFIGILCFSQKIFAIAHEDEKKENWLSAHCKMFEFYRGVPAVIVPDQLKNAVIKGHRYDPDLNPDYVELARHYGTAVVPARVRRPKDKALVENAVGIVMRYFKFIYRRRTFTSLEEINLALREVVAKINGKTHTRFKVSRNNRFEGLELPTLKTLPLEPYNIGEWKRAKLHPDCTVLVRDNYYSAPHIYRGKELRVKCGANLVEIYLDLNRIAVHERIRKKCGERSVILEHLPENARAYREATPQMILAQARFSHPDLHKLIHELFEQDALANLRRAQGLVRKAYAVIQSHSREVANPWIATAIAQMRRFNRIRVKYFEEMIFAEMKKSVQVLGDREIKRQPGNPMVRGHGTHSPSVETQTVPVQIRLL